MERKGTFDMPLMRTGCSKSELARAYFPQIDERLARRNLLRWIRLNPELFQRLIDAGYRVRQRYYTPLQVDIIFDVLGEP